MISSDISQQEDVLPPTPGATGNPSLGALAQMQQFRKDLSGKYDIAAAGREDARSAMDKYYQEAVDALKKPVEDNTWLQMALGTLRPHMPWDSGILNGAQAALAEQQRVSDLNRSNALLSNKLGGEWQKQRMLDFRDEADKLMAQLGKTTNMATSGVGKWVQSKDDQGNLYWTNNATGEQKIVPATKMPLWQKAYSEAYQAAVKQELPNPEDYATGHANEVVGVSPQGVAPRGAAQAGVIPLIGSPGAPPAAARLHPLGPGAQSGTNLPAQTGVGSEVPSGGSVGVIPSNLPPEVSQELERQIARLQANPNNAQLRANTLQRLREIAARYPQASGAVGPDGSIVQAPAAGPSALQYLDQPKRKGEEAYKSEEGKGLYKEFSTLNEAASASSRMQSQLELLKGVYSNPNIPEGELGPKIQEIRSGLKSLGVPIDKSVGAADMARAVASNFAMHLRTGEGINLLPGQMSNYEDKLLQQMSPVLSLTSEGRLALIQYMQEMNTSNMRIAKEAQAMADANKGMLPSNWPQRKTRVEKEEMARLIQLHRRLAAQFQGAQ